MAGRRANWVPILLAALLVAGCWDRRELEERSNVVATGFDLCAPEDTDECRLVATRQIAIPGRIPVGAPGGGGGGGGEEGPAPVEVIRVSGISGADTQGKAQAQVHRKLDLGHTRIVIFSEALARKGLGEFVDFSRRIPEIRRLMWMAISEGPAEELIRARPPLERVPALYLDAMFDDAEKTGRHPGIYLGEWLIRISNQGEEAILPVVRMAPSGLAELAGLAVFRGERMVGRLTPEETVTYMQVRGRRRGSELIRLDLTKGRKADLRVYGRSTDYRVRWVRGRLLVTVKLELEGELQQMTHELESGDPAVMELVESRAEAEVTRRAGDLVRKLQTEWGADILALGERVRAHLPAVWASSDDWPSTFAAARFDFEVQVQVRRTGLAVK